MTRVIKSRGSLQFGYDLETTTSTPDSEREMEFDFQGSLMAESMRLRLGDRTYPDTKVQQWHISFSPLGRRWYGVANICSYVKGHRSYLE